MKLNFKAMKTTVLLMLGILGTEELPITDGALDLSEDQKAALKEAFGDSMDLDKVIEAVNKEIATLSEGAITSEQRLIDAKAEIESLLKAHGLSQEDLAAIKGEVEGSDSDPEHLQEIVGLVKQFVKDTDAKVKKLIDSAEDDLPLHKLKAEQNMKHSKTHLWGSENELNSFDGRPWNQRAAGLVKKPTNFAQDSVEIQKLKDDLELYYRQNPSGVRSLFRDTEGLPSFWPNQINVDDRVADGNIVSAEITQGRKKGWLPKNKQLIQPEEDKIYPVQIDVEHAGWYLQKIETSWLNFMNNEGSQPYKTSFVRFLLSELDKKARQEDRIALIKGVHVQTPETTEIPGLAIHRGDGILIKLWRALHVDKKYRAALIGAPTSENIVDYIKSLIEENVPAEEKNNPGMVIYLSPTWMRRHAERKRFLFGHDNNYTGQELLQVENYPNYKFCPLIDLEGTDFIFITYDDNIVTMENVPGESSMYHIDTLKRDMYIYADYKAGARLPHIGTKTKEGDPDAFKVQTVWSNGLNPFGEGFFVRLYDDGTGAVAMPYQNITITDDFATSIETLSGVPEGTIVRIKGNTAVGAAVKVTDDGNISLTGNADFDLNTGGVLTLRAGANGATFTEIKRTAAPPAAPSEDVDFADATALDADEGTVFNYTGGADTLGNIVGGIEGQQITINGGAGGNLTINDVAGNINVTAQAVVADGDDITFTLVDGVWEEVGRNIA